MESRGNRFLGSDYPFEFIILILRRCFRSYPAIISVSLVSYSLVLVFPGFLFGSFCLASIPLHLCLDRKTFLVL